MDPALDVLCRQIAAAIAEKPGAADTLPQIYLRIADHLKTLDTVAGKGETFPAPVTPTPEILEWARAQFSEEEVIAGLREIQETGGLTFEEVIRGLEPPTNS
jgi:hypothetical protein